MFTNTTLREATRMVPLLLVLLTGICPVTANEMYANAGDLVMLNCRESKHNSTIVPWKMETDQKIQLYSNMSASEQQQLGLVFYQRSLVILRASANHQGNYSCGPHGNTRSQIWFRLTVCPKQSTVCTSRNRYLKVCHAKQACKLFCPEGSIHAGIPRMESMEHVWHKENGEPSDNYFSNVDVDKSGVYICTRSFLYSGEIYQTSSTVELVVQAVEPPAKLGINSPNNGDIFEVELGTKKEIVCKALVNSCQNSPYWTSEGEFVDDLDVHTDPCNGSEKMPKWMSTTLIFREVSPGNLSKTFTCEFSSDKLSSTVNITLVKRAQHLHVMLVVSSVCVLVLMAVIVVVYVKFKIDVTLFLRDKVGFKDGQSSTSDGRSYDAFLMCYKSITDGGLSEEDRKCLASTLEDEFGYSICLYDRDVSPGQAVAEAVLDCIEQSRAVVLVPSFPDPEPGSAVLSAIHTSLVERKTRLIFINTEQTETEASRSGSFPEALQLLSKAGNSVTWKGRPPSTSFWKQLRYHLPAPQQTPKMQLLSQQC